MKYFLTHISIGILTFAITNIDDLLLLSFYFARPGIRKTHVIAGQYLGVFTLVGISLSGLVLGKLLTPPWTGLLGLLPIFLGMKTLLSLFTKNSSNDHRPQPEESIGLINVALITVANGGDNIGVYTPLFASASYLETGLYIFIFSLMIAIWCTLAIFLVTHPWLRNFFANYGHWLLPFFLIALGFYILIQSNSLSLLKALL